MRIAKKFENFRIVRKVRALNLAIQIFLAATLFVGLNYIAGRHFLKFDLSEDYANSLSPESVAHIKNLKKPVEIFMTMQPVKGAADSNASAETSAIIKEISRLLSSYEYESDNGSRKMIKFVSVDPIVSKKMGDELAQRFGSDIENSVIIACGEKNKKLVLSDFYDSFGEKDSKFKGEQAVSSAILSVSNDKVNKIYFLKGHGELNPAATDPNRGLSEFSNALALRGFKLDVLDLSQKGDIPEDADMLIIAAPQTALLPREIDALRNYLLKRNGRVVMFLGLGPIGALGDVLFDWGIRADDMLVVDTSEYESSTGDIVARLYPQKPHEIVRYLVDLGLPVQFGSVRPVREDLGAPIDGSLTLSTLIGSSPTSWAQRNYRSSAPAKYNDMTDLKGPVPLAMVASRKGRSDLGLDIPGGRIAVFGDENFITNSRLNALGNSKLALNTINWMFDDNTSLNIAPRKAARYSLTLSRGDMNSLALRLLFLPLFVLFAGFVTYILRRQ